MTFWSACKRHQRLLLFSSEFADANSERSTLRAVLLDSLVAIYRTVLYVIPPISNGILFPKLHMFSCFYNPWKGRLPNWDIWLMGKYEDMRDSALSIIDEYGVRALTLSLLFERAHTGAGTFYHYFKDREDLIDAIFRHCCDIAANELLDTDDPETPTHQRFNDFCHHMFHAYLYHPRELNFLYWYTFGYVEPDMNFCPVIPSILLLTDILNHAKTEGLVKQNVASSFMARVVRSMMASVFWAYQRNIYVMDDESAQRFADSAWRALEVFENVDSQANEI